MMKYEQPIMDIIVLDIVGTLIEVSSGGNQTIVPASEDFSG